ncbi:MAG: dihydrolipoyl dehydrogenase [Thermoplasmata archaeon]|nr:dihydrolipoyl dehydrogenase [Thermoplasmata archaeon]
MKEYDVILIGSGSGMYVLEGLLRKNPDMKAAVIEKDEPGGICLTRGCIPTKLLLYPAELVRLIGEANNFGIEAEIKKLDFEKVMKRMRNRIDSEIEQIRHGLSHHKNIDFYPITAEFVEPYVLNVGGERISSKLILLCTGSKPAIPKIRGIEKVKYHTSDTILHITKLPKRLAIIGGGYIAAEFGHFFSAMGSEVTIIGRNPQFLPDEEPEIAEVARQTLSKHMKIFTNYEVIELQQTITGKKKIIAHERTSKKPEAFEADEVLIATGRASNADILHPERAGIKTDEHGWIAVNEFLQTTAEGVWAFGDCIGGYQFKHVANYEAMVVYYNLISDIPRAKVDYHAVPRAIFTYPEVASVGMGEKEAIEKHGKDNILIGAYRYEDTAKGEAMGAKDYFVKVLVKKDNLEILGAHIVGPEASILIQEIVNLMYTEDRSAVPLLQSMHIHPALSEVVERAFNSLMPLDHYHHILDHHFGA